jgi:hypothetical protein
LEDHINPCLLETDKDHDINVIMFMTWKEENHTCHGVNLRVSLALSHNTTGNSGNSTPELDFTSHLAGQKLGNCDQVTENTRGLGLRWQCQWLRGHFLKLANIRISPAAARV